MRTYLAAAAFVVSAVARVAPAAAQDPPARPDAPSAPRAPVPSAVPVSSAARAGTSEISAVPTPPAAPRASDPAGVLPEQPVRAGRGRLRVAVNRPDTLVWIDGERAGVAPFDRDLPAGAHAVRLEAYGHRAWRGTVELAAGFRVPLRAWLRPAPARVHAWALLAASAALVAGGVALGAGALSDRGALDAARAAGTLDDRDPRIARGAALAVTADVVFGLSAAVAALAVFFFAYEPPPGSSARVGRPRALPVVP